MADKATTIDGLVQEIYRLRSENDRLRSLVASLRTARTTTPAQQVYMSGRWHRRDGDVYGIVVEGDGVTDANSPPGNLRPSR